MSSAPFSTSPNIQLPELPTDIYLEILKCLPSSRNDDTSIQTLASCLLANSRVRAAALSPLVWKHHYHVRYTHCVEAKETARRQEASDDWRVLYTQRRQLDRGALKLVDKIRVHTEGRHERARVFAWEYSFDAWDALRLESQIPVPLHLQTEYAGPSDTDVVEREDVLPRRFWAQAVLGMLARLESVKVWKTIFIPMASSPPVPFVHAFASLSSVFSVSMREIELQLDEIHDSCVELLRTRSLPNAQTDLQRRCIAIAQALFSLGFGIADGSTFQRLLNQFPHAFLPSSYRHTIPISLVFVFVAVARRMGIAASPLNTPGVVKAHIASPDPSEPDFLLDITSPIPAALILVDGRTGTPGVSRADLEPATSFAMLQRSFNNIISFARFEQVLGTAEASCAAQDSAFYMLSICTVLQTQQINIHPTPPDFNPLDLVVVLLDSLADGLQDVGRRDLTEFLEASWRQTEDLAKERRVRSEHKSVKGFVGMTFTHKAYAYIGCIYGWDPVCMASDDWIVSMGVRDLPSGQHQPFYKVCSTSGRIFYVAQDNIEPVCPNREIARKLLRARDTFSRFFTGLDVFEERAGRLKLSDELKTRYPEDDAFGDRWIHRARGDSGWEE